MQISKQDKFTTYTQTKIYGKDDLKSIYPYWSTEWETTFHPEFKDVTEQWYLDHTSEYNERVNKWNENHIKELKEKGLFETEYHTSISFMHNPLYDDNKIDFKPKLESHKVVFLNFSKYGED